MCAGGGNRDGDGFMDSEDRIFVKRSDNDTFKQAKEQNSSHGAGGKRIILYYISGADDGRGEDGGKTQRTRATPVLTCDGDVNSFNFTEGYYDCRISHCHKTTIWFWKILQKLEIHGWKQNKTLLWRRRGSPTSRPGYSIFLFSNSCAGQNNKTKTKL